MVRWKLKNCPRCGGDFFIERDLDGEIRHSRGTIALRPGMTPEFNRVILWHEVLHAMVTNGGRELSEELVVMLAYGIVDVITNNPILHNWTQGEEEPTK